MTEHYTMEEAIELARECGSRVIRPIWPHESSIHAYLFSEEKLHTLINTAVSRKLAECQKDAERYRWMMDRVAFGDWSVCTHKTIDRYGRDELHGRRLQGNAQEKP